MPPEGEAGQNGDLSLGVDAVHVRGRVDGLGVAQALGELQRSPDLNLILLDMVMPGVSGMDLLKVLKKSENWSNISVIFLTSLEGVDIELEGFTNGASDFLQKPVNAELLRLKIKRQLFIQDLKAENQHLQKTLQTLHSRIDQVFNEVLP